MKKINIIIILLIVLIFVIIYILLNKYIPRFSCFENKDDKKYHLTSSGGGIRAMYGAYSFIKATQINNNLNNIINIGVVSGSSWFFTLLFYNKYFNDDVFKKSPEEFVKNWNNNYCNNIREFKKQQLQEKLKCKMMDKLFKYIENITTFINIPAKNWKNFIDKVILNYNNGYLLKPEKPLYINKNLLYGISLPFMIFKDDYNNNSIYIKRDKKIFYKSYNLCLPIYYSNNDRLFHAPGLNNETLMIYKKNLNNCNIDLNYSNNNENVNNFKIKNLKDNDKNISNISAACSAAIGLLSCPVILRDLLKNKISPLHNDNICNNIIECLPNDSIDLSIDVNIDDNNIYKIIDGAYTDNSALTITLSNILKDQPSKNNIINIISLNHSPIVIDNISKKIKKDSIDIHHLFNDLKKKK